MNIGISSRDAVFIGIGIAITFIFGGWMTIRIHEENLKYVVTSWIEAHKPELNSAGMDREVRLVTNTGQTGTIWLILPLTESEWERKFESIAIKLAELRCPYGISK